MDLADLEIQGKLQVKVARTILRDKLVMGGNVLLVAYLFSLVLLSIWYVAYLRIGPDQLLSLGVVPPGLTVEQYQHLSVAGLALWKVSGALLLLCPGLALRVCGAAMRP
jgi:hypothetical protein